MKVKELTIIANYLNIIIPKNNNRKILYDKIIDKQKNKKYIIRLYN